MRKVPEGNQIRRTEMFKYSVLLIPARLMHRIGCIVVFVLLMVVLVPMAVVDDAPAVGVGVPCGSVPLNRTVLPSPWSPTCWGRVVDYTGNGVSGVPVEVWRTERDAEGDVMLTEWLAEEVSSDNGTFGFTLELLSNSVLKIGNTDWAVTYWPGVVDLKSANVFGESGVINQDFGAMSVQPASTVTGLVVDSVGLPVGGLPVAIKQISGGGVTNETETMPVVGQVETDTDGQFMFTGLSAGVVDISWGKTDEFVSSEVSGGSVRLTIGVGGSVVLTEPVLAVRASSLSGTVVSEQGAIVSDSTVSVYRQVGDEWEESGWDTTNENGDFTVTGLLPGNYKVQASGVGDLVTAWAADGLKEIRIVEINQGENFDFGDIILPLGASVAGCAISADGLSVEGLWAIAFTQLMTQEGVSTWNTVSSSQLDQDGCYLIDGLPAGPSLVFIDGGDQLVGIYADGSVVEEESVPIDLTQGEIDDLGSVVLSSAGAVEGSVVNELGEAASGVPVFVMRETIANEWVPVEGGQTDSNGNYLVHGLSAGSYRIVPAGDPNESDYIFNTPLVNVEAGQTIQADIASPMLSDATELAT
ncbi:MAG: carboxypeptidase regulatory-like domain-containing protein, partial [Bifidobacteriaceae bacterium]|nr:carboxypeptidase regulatory-like domain-containing protein [Bifidobacteriaceae bacterium]